MVERIFRKDGKISGNKIRKYIVLVNAISEEKENFNNSYRMKISKRNTRSCIVPRKHFLLANSSLLSRTATFNSSHEQYLSIEFID